MCLRWSVYPVQCLRPTNPTTTRDHESFGLAEGLPLTLPRAHRLQTRATLETRSPGYLRQDRSSDEMNLFDQRNQSVTTQFNAARDIHITIGGTAADPFAEVGAADLDALEAGIARSVEQEIEGIRSSWRRGDVESRPGSVFRACRLTNAVSGTYPTQFERGCSICGRACCRIAPAMAPRPLQRWTKRSGFAPLSTSGVSVPQLAYAAERSGTAAASMAAALQGTSDVDDVLARCAFLLEAGKAAEAEQELQTVSPIARRSMQSVCGYYLMYIWHGERSRKPRAQLMRRSRLSLTGWQTGTRRQLSGTLALSRRPCWVVRSAWSQPTLH